MSTFTVNGKEYQAKPFDFNMVCELEDMGIRLQDAAKKPMGMVRAYFSICAGRDKDFVGKEMEQHIIAGGSFEEIMNVLSDEMEKSDFFRSLGKGAETKTGTSQTKTQSSQRKAEAKK